MLCAILILLPGTVAPSIVRSMFICPNLILRNVITGRVYRNAKLGCINSISDEILSWDEGSTYSRPTFVTETRNNPTSRTAVDPNGDEGFALVQIREPVALLSPRRPCHESETVDGGARNKPVIL